MMTNPDPARLPRLRLRPVRSVCLDTSHTDPSAPCAWCDSAPLADETVGIALAQHADLVAEDAALYGWDA